ncbi:HAD family hydrolase [Hamadaea tsunoensis]|uniref:HAD family hydrolase n=1 Tax=Hamadaea tsunoensis TaxID=53368 RepID=UPI00040AE25C|nr:HAD family hydrolase [Hamadaea tsunoensis]
MQPPHALLLDFGGVLAEKTDRTVDPGLYEWVHQVTGGVLGTERIKADMAAANKARNEWRENAENPELSHEQLWRDFVAKDWPEPAREAAVAYASEFTYAWENARFRLVDGMAEVLEWALGRGLPVAVVSNTRCGKVFRDFLDEAGLTGALPVQIYSDEAGVFKPHPEMIFAAARALNVSPARCWFVGDSLHRDIECGRRAGVAAAVLRPSRYRDNEQWDIEPDAVVTDGHELLKLLKDALEP